MVISLFCHECGVKRATAKSLYKHYLYEHKYDHDMSFSSVRDAIELRRETNQNILEQKQKSNKKTLREFKPGLTYVDLQKGTYQHFDDKKPTHFK